MSCDLDSIIKWANELGQGVDDLSEKVEEGHWALKWLNTDLDEILARIVAGKR